MNLKGVGFVFESIQERPASDLGLCHADTGSRRLTTAQPIATAAA